MRLSSVKIGMRLTAGFGLMMVGLVLMTTIGALQMNSMDERMESVVHVDNRKTALSQTMTEQVHILSRQLRSLLLFDEAAQRQAELEQIKKVVAVYDQAWQELNAMPLSDREKELLKVVESARAGAQPLNDRVTSLVQRERIDTARHVLNQMAIPLTQAWLDALDGMVAYQADRSVKSYEHARDAYRHGLLMLIGSALVGAVIGMAAAYLITRSITRPMEYLRQCALRMADGDLSQPVERRLGFDGKDETSQLVAAMQRMHDSLSALVSEVHANANQVAAAAVQISQGNSDLSARTEQQASNLQQTAASMEHFTTTIRRNADNARQADSLAAGATQVAREGGVVMERVVGTMRDIQQGSNKIAEIISVIDGIAFQTNILALNAAVEAARAGDAGRGFAVVASEVRALAQRSAAAAREIKTLIGSSVELVDGGHQLVEEAGRTMHNIVESIRRVNDIVAEISGASREQSEGVGQVNSAVADMDRSTQANAALVEQSAAAADSLREQAQQMVTTVSRFRLAA